MPVHKPVHDADGKVVPGLSVTHSWSRGAGNPKQTRYYITGTKPIHWLVFDKDESIRQLRLIQARDRKDKIVIPDVYRRIKAGLIPSDMPIFEIERTVVDDDLFWQIVRHHMIKDPKLAAQKLGIPEIAWLHRVKQPPPSLPIREPLNLYLARRKRITKGEQTNLREAWRLFFETVGVKLVEDVTEAKVDKWHGVICERLDSGR